MSIKTIGSRVGTILSGDDKEVNLFGYGIYNGYQVPKEAVGFFSDELIEQGIENPEILLDNGKKVYGCECWWGSEEKIKKMIKDKKVNIIDVDEYRRENQRKEEINK